MVSSKGAQTPNATLILEIFRPGIKPLKGSTETAFKKKPAANSQQPRARCQELNHNHYVSQWFPGNGRRRHDAIAGRIPHRDQ